MTTIVAQLVTAEELLEMPRGQFRCELVKGEFRKMSPAGNNHGRIAMNLSISLGPHVKAKKLGAVYAAETGFILSSNPDTVRAPDVAFICKKRMEEVGEVEGYWPGPPDLAVEVISPSDRYTEVDEKNLDWLDAGTRMVIVVNPRKRTATIYRSRTDIHVLTEGDTLDGADVVPEWIMPVKELFV